MKILDDFKNEIKIIINNNILDEYRRFYFKQFPRRRKFPFKSPIPDSLNKWMVLPRLSMNDKKQKCTDFAEWLISYYKYSDLLLEKCGIAINYYFADKRRRDPDNYTPKNFTDGFTKAGLFIDDNFDVIDYMIIQKLGVDKTNPRTEFIIRY